MVADNRYCYFPSGNIAKDNVPCSDDTSATCCGPKDICLSNGLCLNVGHQPYVLSRGACTNSDWNSGCTSYCSKSTPTMGASIINLLFVNNTSLYCCGTPIIDGGKIVCPDGPASGFQVPTGWPIPGRALLANSTLLDAIAVTPSINATASTSSTASTPSSASASSSSSSTSSSSSSSPPSPSGSLNTCSTCHETAVGAGVGVPLGVIALFSIIWALFERRRAWKGRGMPPAAGTPYSGPYTNVRDRRNRPVELEDANGVPELPSSMDSPSEIMSKASVR